MFVRKRPLSADEHRMRMFDVVTVAHGSARSVVVHEPKTRVDMCRSIDHHAFVFDAVFDDSASNEMVYKVRGC